MPLSPAQKAAVTQLATFTACDKKTAEKLLRANGWNVQTAVDAVYSSSRTDTHGPALSKIFDQYRGPSDDDPDRMLIDSTMAYLSDLGVSLDSITVLIFSELLDSPSVGEVTRQGFIAGWSLHEASTLDAQKKLLQNMTDEVQGASIEQRASQTSIYRRTYKATFRIALPPGTRSVPLEMATEYWRLLLGEQAGVAWHSDSTPWLEWYIEFLEANWQKAVNKDLWEQTLRFALETLKDETMAWWSEEAAWPGILDEFVEWVRARRKENGGQNAMDVEE